MTKNERRLLGLAQKRGRLITRIVKNKREHRATAALSAKLVDVVAEQLKTEMRIERKRA